MNLSARIRSQKPSIATPPARKPELLSPRSLFIVALCSAAAVFVLYGPSLDFQFILDDHRFLSDPRIQSSGYVWDYFANYVWAQFTGGPSTFYRPLFVLWLRANFVVSGMSPWGWHLLSIAKHALVAILLGLLVWRLVRDRVAAVIAAVLFALHPAHTESVAWVTVPDPLMSAGVLVALLLYLRYVMGPSGMQLQPQKSRKASRIHKAAGPSPWWLLGSAAAGLAAMLAKETAVILPAVIFVLALCRPWGEPGRTGRRSHNDASFRIRLEQALRQTAPFAGVTAVYLLLRFHALGGRIGALTQHLPWKTVLLSWPATLWFYLRVLMWPVRSHAFADPTVEASFSVRGVLLPGIGVGCGVAVLAGIVFWTWKLARRDLPPREAAGVECGLLMGTLLLALPLFLALDLNALNPGDFLHGRYAYLPSAGLMLVVAMGWHMAGKARIPLLFACGLLAAAFTAFTLAQEGQWKDDSAVFTIAHELAPRNVPVAENLANTQVQAALQLDEEGRCSEAVPVFMQVTEEYPQDWYAWAGLGDCFVQLNDFPKAEQSLHRAAEISHQPRVMEQWQQLRAKMGLPSPPATE